MTISSETSAPESMIAATRLPSSEPEARAARSMSPVESWTMPRSATSRLAWVPLPAAGGPNRIRFTSVPFTARSFDLLIRPSYWCAEQVRLDLRHRVHGHRDDDQDRGAAEIERPPRSCDQQFRQQADGGDVGRADHRQAGQHVVEVFRRPLAGTDARQEAAVLAQVLRRLFRVEDDRGVEEAEEDDQRARRAP